MAKYIPLKDILALSQKDNSADELRLLHDKIKEHPHRLNFSDANLFSYKSLLYQMLEKFLLIGNDFILKNHPSEEKLNLKNSALLEKYGRLVKKSIADNDYLFTEYFINVVHVFIDNNKIDYLYDCDYHKDNVYQLSLFPLKISNEVQDFYTAHTKRDVEKLSRDEKSDYYKAILVKALSYLENNKFYSQKDSRYLEDYRIINVIISNAFYWALKLSSYSYIGNWSGMIHDYNCAIGNRNFKHINNCLKTIREFLNKDVFNSYPVFHTSSNKPDFVPTEYNWVVKQVKSERGEITEKFLPDFSREDLTLWIEKIQNDDAYSKYKDSNTLRWFAELLSYCE